MLSEALHAFIIFTALWLLSTSYQISVRRNYALIRDDAHKPLLHPERIARKFARNAAAAGVALLFVCLATPMLSISFAVWIVGIGIVIAVYAVARISLIDEHKRYIETQNII
jgi:uncharacterized membrane protein YecN with MAPEG domain